jgi:hypothetical protein
MTPRSEPLLGTAKAFEIKAELPNRSLRSTPLGSGVPLVAPPDPG